MKKKFTKPEMKIVKIQTDDIMLVSDMVLGKVSGSVGYFSTPGMAGGTVGGNVGYTNQ